MNDYLDTVGAQIRWKRARPALLRELEQHLTDQRDAFLEEGADGESAERMAVEEMGDPVAVGTELDRLHRPKPQWGLLAATLALALLGGFLRVWLTASGAKSYENIDPILTALALALGSGCLLGAYLLDYTWLVRHAGGVYAGAVVLGLVTLWLSPVRNYASYYTHYVVLLYPTAYALWLYRCRGKGWNGFFLTVLGGVPLAAVAGAVPDMLGVCILLGTGFALLLTAAASDWFGIGKWRTALAAAGIAAAVALAAVWMAAGHGLLQRRLSICLHPEQDPLGYGYQGVMVRAALAASQWRGGGSEVVSPYSYERSVPGWNRDFLLTTMVYKLGWLPFLLLVLAVAGLLAWLLWKCLRQKNQAGQLVALSVILPLGVQAALSLMQNLGYLLFSASMPLVTGNLVTVVFMGLIGVALSVFREERLVPTLCGAGCGALAPLPRIRLCFQNEEDAQNGDWVLSVSLIISGLGTNEEEETSEWQEENGECVPLER